MKSSLFESMTQQVFGDGRPAQLVELTNRHGMSIVLMDVGATWLSCRLPLAQQSREVLLGVDTMANFVAQGAYMGASVGRYANRIANARYRYQDDEIQVVASQGKNCLHGGAPGWSHRRWTLDSQGDHFACFRIESEDGEQGFPGHVSASVRYELGEDNQVSITYRATTDKPTPVNLTNHAYFNLMGAESGCDVLGHTLSIAASEYLPIDDTAIPLGQLAPVQGSGFDFQQVKTIGQDLLKDEQQQASKGYDHSYWLNDECRSGQCAATLTSDDQQVVLQVFTSKPTLQLYSGNWLQGTPGRNGNEYQSYQGVALETQFLPDSPNHPEWDQQSCILLPEQEYKFTTVYQFQLA